MGHLEEPVNYNMKDLCLDVRLETCKNGSFYDFTGRKTFSTTFYRQNIGFGITDISIEVNPSLQPIIDITFKDLYGNTSLGSKRNTGSEEDDQIDTSVLFDWPPPKFIFSFKGFLGRRVTWMLNLKTTNISFVPSDGSYEIKCSFVPNQWGFLADLPVLYLMACKKLRYESYGNSNSKTIGGCVFDSDSVFSYVRLGKKVDIKTQEETKDFELILKQMGSIKYGLSAAICGAKIIIPGEPIIGKVNNIEIQGFTNLQINIPSKQIDDLIRDYKDTSNVNKIDSFLQFNISRGEISNPQSNSNFVSIYGNSVDYNDFEKNGNLKNDSTQKDTFRKSLFSIVDANIEAINKEIQRRIYSSTKNEISKLTIGEVFRQIARDSGFILGSILQAGFEGYYNNRATRDSDEGKRKLIGKNFPLCTNDDREEIPAIGFGDFGVEKYEMAFVEKFIGAIGEGIADNLISDDIAYAGDDKIQHRINNLEAIRPNPYKPFFSNIAENVLIRSGIIAFITRSGDPALPGDFPNDNGTDRDYSVSSIISLAKSDMENLTKDILGQLNFEDVQKLKRFCGFFDTLIADVPENYSNLITVGDILQFYNISTKETMFLPFDLVANDYNSPVEPNLWQLPVKIGDVSKELIQDVGQAGANVNTNITHLQNSIAGTPVSQRTEKEYVTFAEIIRDVIPEIQSINGYVATGTTMNNNSIFPPANSEIPSFRNASLIRPLSLVSDLVVNNGLYWSLPKPNRDEYCYVLFTTPSDSTNAREVQVQDATTSDKFEGTNWLGQSTEDFVGFIPIDQWEKVNGEGGVSNVIEVINKRIHDGNCINYDACKVMHTNTEDYLQKNEIQNSKIIGINEIEARNLCFAIYTHMCKSNIAGNNSQTLVFGPFMKPTAPDDHRAKNQRAAIKTMCKSILKKLEDLEVEKSEVIASVFGKANEAKNALYKQMHYIFHQWQSVATTLFGTQNYCEEYNPSDKQPLSELLEIEFGHCESHKNRNKNDELNNLVPSHHNTLFVYDYPLAQVNGTPIDVKNSIINIEPLYKPNGNTTALNIIQQICTKNNFVFVPFPGDASSDKINEIFYPYPNDTNHELKNYFHVIFTPTPETRTRLSNNSQEFITDYMNDSDFGNAAISVEFGAVNNQIFKGINVGTDSTKPTAESILNVQRLVDKENSNHNVAMDCSMLPVYEGRSYRAKVDMIGNAQVYPMQYFYLKKMPMFGGLYQILKVNHSITPNDMSTSVEGVRMRFDIDKRQYAGILPITLDKLKELGEVSKPMEAEVVVSYGKEVDSYDVGTLFNGSEDINYSDFDEEIESGFSGLYDKVKKGFLGYQTKPKNISFFNEAHENNMKSIGWGAGASWCSLFVKNIYKHILTGKQKDEAMNFISANTFQTVKNAENGLNYFKLTKKPSVGSYVAWKNTNQDSPGIVKGHAALVIDVDIQNNKMTVIEGNYGGCGPEINLQSSQCGSRSIIKTYDSTIGSYRDSNNLHLIAFITPKSQIGIDVDANLANFENISEKDRANTILYFCDSLSPSQKTNSISKLTQNRRMAIFTYVNSVTIADVTSDKIETFKLYLSGQI